MNLDDPDDRTVACAEFVLGVLEPDERLAFEAELMRDAGLREEVGRWQDRLLALADDVAPVVPSDAVWRRIEAGLGPPGTPAPAPRGPAAATPSGTPGARAARPARVGLWMGLAGFATAASLVLATLLALERRDAPESWIAVLEAPDRQVRWVVQIAAHGPVRLVPLADPGPVPADRVRQFWTKPRDAEAPTSLGLLPDGGAMSVPRDRVPGPYDDALFEITLEPAGGSPTGRPTGPVLHIGRATRVGPGT